MPHPLPLATNPCSDGETICNTAFNWTGNEPFARYSDVLIGKPLALLALIALAVLVRWVLHKVIGRLVRRSSNNVKPGSNGASARRAQRMETMGGLFRSMVTGLVVAVFGTMMLSELGVNIAPIIASAGILGLALGFGAQSLVRDFLTGMFIMIEDQFGVGDIVNLGEAIGTVEAISLRVTRLRDLNGSVWYVPNGEIYRVSNLSQNWSRSVLDVRVSYHTDLSRVREVLEEIAHHLWEEQEFQGEIIEEPEVWGVQELAADAVTVRIVLKTTPGSQWAIEREMRQRIKARFDEEGIEIPFAQRVIWQHEPNPGSAASESSNTGAPQRTGAD